MTDAVPVAFTIDELRLLQSVVRHEIQQQEWVPRRVARLKGEQEP